MREWVAEHRDLVDALLAVALLVAGLVGVRLGTVPGEPDAVIVRDLLVVALCLPLARRRCEPRVVLVLVTLAAAGIWIGGFVDGPTALAGALAFYGVGRYIERPASVQTFAITGGFLAVVAAWMSALGDSDTWFTFAARCGVIVAAFAIGDSQRSREALLASLRAQTQRAESLRVLEAERAVSGERARIAREMHDVVAHSLSVMVVQSVAAERSAVTDSDAAVQSIASVAEVGRHALGEMRRIFQVLDDGGSVDLAPQPTLADLDVIIERYRSAGVDVVVHRDRAVPALEPVTELSIVRIIQERNRRFYCSFYCAAWYGGVRDRTAGLR